MANPGTKVAISQAGTHELFTAALKKHPGDIHILENALVALSNLAFMDAAASMEVLNVGGVDAVLATMRSFPDENNIQALGCNAIANLAYNSTEVAKAVIIGGGVDLVVVAFTAHVGCLTCRLTRVQHWLASLVPDVSGATIKETVDTVLLVDALRAYRRHPVIRNHCCQALRYMNGTEGSETRSAGCAESSS